MTLSESLLSCPCRKSCFRAHVQKRVSMSASKSLFLRKPFYIRVEKHVSLSVFKSLFLWLCLKACFHAGVEKPVSMLVSESLSRCPYQKAYVHVGVKCLFQCLWQKACVGVESLFPCPCLKVYLHIHVRKSISMSESLTLSSCRKTCLHPKSWVTQKLGSQSLDTHRNLDTTSWFA